MGVFAAWTATGEYVVRGEFDPDQARVVARVLYDAGMVKESDEWSEAADRVVEAKHEQAEIDAARDRAFQREHPPVVEGDTP